ncbi:bacterial bifunctional deaminase-reductase [Trametes versicolor FP-101664 SS1]|uniref:bacterial bifunctional deaminase-reductase n=1 Tax=Trametes versicolor (strain FP-101664) TaxID=717944 RepID=UPI0004621DC6|nr:bacterial bifunctional deaminase-reductase [Trametes versicolor FP-101664 SS1]EIW63974.1 bacterial bifunctional deaminase-reductase [Trametes versicolor FP-101664 SS1]
MSSPLSQTLPRPPPILLDLYGLPASEAIHPSIYEESREASLFTPSNDENRPCVTLTFAQSLDAKIAGAGGKQLILSGKESMVMTHWMRTLHDAIVVGIGTALNDDPQLNTRHLPPLPEGHPHGYRIPRPVILDTHLRLPPTCKLLRNYQAGRGRRPWVVCARRTGSRDVAGNEAFTKRAAALQNAGARIVEVDADEATGAIAIPALLSALRELGVRSVMVEGGARVIRAFLSAAAPAHRSAGSGSGSGDTDTKTENAKAVDALVVTVAPTLVGAAGVGYGTELLADALPTFQHVRTEAFGPDAVTALKVL